MDENQMMQRMESMTAYELQLTKRPPAVHITDPIMPDDL
jgi:hypothetical protein